MCCKKGVLRNFANFTRKHLSQSLFLNKVAGLSPAILSKKRLWRRCFPVNFAKFLRTPFLTEHPRWLLLTLAVSVSVSTLYFLLDVFSFFTTLFHDYWERIACKVGFPLVDFFHRKRLFSMRKFLIIGNIKKTPQIKSEAVAQRCTLNKMFLEISGNFGKHLCQSSFLIKLQASGLELNWKRDSGSGVFLWILWSLQEHQFS